MKKRFAMRGLSLLLALTMVLGMTMTVFAEDKPTPVTEIQWQNSDLNNGAIKDSMDKAAEAAEAAKDAASDADDAAAAAKNVADALNGKVDSAEKAVFDTETDDKGNLKKDADGKTVMTPAAADPNENVDLDNKNNPSNKLNNDIEQPIVGAEKIAKDANDAIGEKEESAAKVAGDAANKAENKAKEAGQAADHAQQAANDAQTALDAAKAAKTEADAKNAVEEANKAAEEADKAAEDAKGKYEEAQTILDDAQAAVDQLIKELEALLEGTEEDTTNGTPATEGYKDKLETKIAAAKAAIKTAQDAVDLAKKAVKEASDQKKTAEDYAKEAANKAAEAKTQADNAKNESNSIDAVVKQPVLNQIEDAKKVVNNKQGAYDSTLTIQEEIKKTSNTEIERLNGVKDDNQDIIDNKNTLITNTTNEKKSLENDADYLKAKADVKSVTKGLISDLDIAMYVKEQGIGKRNSYNWFKKITETEYNEAVKLVNKYNADQKKINDQKDAIAEKNAIIKNAKSDIETAKNNKTEADKKIRAEEQKIANADLAISGALNELNSAKNVQSQLEIYLASFNYERVNPLDLTELTKEDQEQYKNLFGKLETSSDSYNGVYNDTQTYNWAAQNILDIIAKMAGSHNLEELAKNWAEIKEKEGYEKEIETKYRTWKFNDGTFVILYDDGKNGQMLVKLEKEKAEVLSLDEKEFACYSAAFDKVEAAKASDRAAKASEDAAKAKKAESEAKTRLENAQKALSDAQTRLEKIKINGYEFAKAKAELERAKKEVETAKGKYNDAKDAADDAEKKAKDAEKELDRFKPTSNPGGGEGGDDTTTPVVPPQAAAPLTTIQGAAVPMAAAPGAGRNVNALQNNADENDGNDAVVIEEDEAPLAPNAQTEDESEDTKKIDEQPTPLAAQVQKNGFNWWWLLLILAILAAGSATAYQINKKNKAANANGSEE